MTLLDVETTARLAWAGALLLAPDRLLRTGGRPPAPGYAVTVARVLGARHLAQAMLRPTGVGAVVSAGLDATHALTDVVLAAFSPRWRPIASIDAAIAAGFAASGWIRR